MADLIITESINLNSGDVEVIILQPSKTRENFSFSDQQSEKRPSKVKTFQQWFAKTEATASEREPDQAKWEYLKEKYNL